MAVTWCPFLKALTEIEKGSEYTRKITQTLTAAEEIYLLALVLLITGPYFSARLSTESLSLFSRHNSIISGFSCGWGPPFEVSETVAWLLCFFHWLCTSIVFLIPCIYTAPQEILPLGLPPMVFLARCIFTCCSSKYAYVTLCTEELCMRDIAAFLTSSLLLCTGVYPLERVPFVVSDSLATFSCF